MSGFCHFGLVLFMVLWRSPDTPVMSGFHVSVRSLVCVPCFVLERGVRIPALVSWVSVSCRGSDTRAPCSVLLCERAVSSSLCRALSCPRVFLCCMQFVFLSAACIHVMSCAVWYAACVFHWLCAFMLSCLVWTRGLWVFSLAACSCLVLHMAGDLFCWPCACVLFCVSTWLLSLFSVCHVLSCELSWPHPSCYLIIG